MKPISKPLSTILSTNHVIVLTGNCASGKSTIAQILSEKYGYVYIDGDNVWKLKKKQNPDKNKKIHWDEIHLDIMNLAKEQLDKDNVVIAHLILPNRISEYEKWALINKVSIYFVVLYPDIDKINDRNLTRTCWSKPTPDYIINTVQSLFGDSKKSLKQYYYDNANESPLITARKIMQLNALKKC